MVSRKPKEGFRIGQVPTGSNAAEWTKGMGTEQLPLGLATGRCCNCGGAVSGDGDGSQVVADQGGTGEWKW